MKIYLIKHIYDVDGGCGDAVYNEETLGIFTDEDMAKAYVEKWSCEKVYAKPYDELCYGHLYVQEEELNTLDINENPFEHYFDVMRKRYLEREEKQ